MRRLFNYLGKNLEHLLVYSSMATKNKIVVSTINGHYEWIDTFNVHSITLFRLAKFMQYGFPLAITHLKWWATIKYVFTIKENRWPTIKWWLRQFITIQNLHIEMFRPNDQWQCTYHTPYHNFY